MARTRHGGDARGIGFRKQNQHRVGGWNAIPTVEE